MKIFLFIWLLFWNAHAQDPMFQGNTDPRQTLNESHQQEQSILAELSTLDKNLQQLQSELSNLELEQENISQKQQTYQTELQNISQQFQKIEAHLIEKTNLLYTIHKRGIARIVFGAENPADLRRRSMYLKSLIKTDKERLSRFQELAKEQKDLAKSLTRSKNQLETLAQTLEQKKDTLLAERQRKMDILQQVQNEKRLAMQYIQELNRSQQRFQNQLPSNQNSLIQISDSNSSFKDLYGKLSWPIQGTLLRRFGKQKDPISGEVIKSNGIDIQAPNGTPVRVVADGVVALARFIDTYGQTVVVNHGKYSTVYAHLNGVQVSQGQKVSANQTIGLVGNTGVTDTQNNSWLTFEIRYQKSPQDPLQWLKR